MDNEEQGMSPLPQEGKMLFNFPNAMQQIIEGKRIQREEWENKEEYCLLKDAFLMIYRNGKFHQWVINDGDLLAEDWIVLPEGN